MHVVIILLPASIMECFFKAKLVIIFVYDSDIYSHMLRTSLLFAANHCKSVFYSTTLNKSCSRSYLYYWCFGFSISLTHNYTFRISDNRADNFIVGVTNISYAVSRPVRGAYSLCGQYPTALDPGLDHTQYCSADTPPGEFVIVQQPATGVGSLTICELQVFGCVT